MWTTYLLLLSAIHLPLAVAKAHVTAMEIAHAAQITSQMIVLLIVLQQQPVMAMERVIPPLVRACALVTLPEALVQHVLAIILEAHALLFVMLQPHAMDTVLVTAMVSVYAVKITTGLIATQIVWQPLPAMGMELATQL
jgi:hypothetical protein